MRCKPIVLTLLAWVAAGLTLALAGDAPTSGGPKAGAAGGLKVEVQLVWGTDQEQSPDANHKPVEPDVRKKLKELPLKWSNYFMVNKKKLTVPPGDAKKENLSEKCAIEVKDLGNSMVEISFFGKGKKVEKRTLAFPKGEMLLYGGNAPNETAWLVVVKRVE